MKNEPRRRKALCCLALLVALLSVCRLALALGITVDAARYPVEPDGWYSTMEEVAVYLDAYGELPENYLTKNEARALGWSSSRGDLWDVAPGCSIGGDRYGNYEGIVPDAKGRSWIECDIDYGGGYRGAKRIVYASDGLIYYTQDHYETFYPIEVIWDRTESYQTDYGESAYDRTDYGETDTAAMFDWVLDLIWRE